MTTKNAALYERAIQEIESVDHEADALDDPLATVKIKARAVSLMWSQSPSHARKRFHEIWDYIEQKQLNKKDAGIAILGPLYFKDRDLARQLLQKMRESLRTQPSSEPDKQVGKDPEATAVTLVAMRLLETDAHIAAEVLKESLDENTALMMQMALTRLRAKNASLANEVASYALDKIASQPNIKAVLGAANIGGYLFPIGGPLSIAIDAQPSDETLRAKFFNIAYPILKASLAETDGDLVRERRMAPETALPRTASQATLAAILIPLARLFAADLVPELNEIAGGLTASIPPDFAGLIRLQSVAASGVAEENDDPLTVMSAALFGRDFDRAQRVIDSTDDEGKKKSLKFFLQREQVKTCLASGMLVEAFAAARSLDDPLARVNILIGVAEAARQKNDKALAKEVVAEIRQIPALPELKGSHVRGLFSLTAEVAWFSQPDAVSILEEAVDEFNSLVIEKTQVSDQKSASPIMVKLNNPDEFLDSTEVAKAFSDLGNSDLETILSIAGRINHKAVQLLARLATVKKIIES